MSPHEERKGLLERWARTAVNHRWAVLTVWLVIFAGLGVTAYTSGGTFNDSISIPSSGSENAQNVLDSRFPARSGDTAQLVFEAEGSQDIQSPEIRNQVERTLTSAEALPGVSSIRSPYEPPAGATAPQQGGSESGSESGSRGGSQGAAPPGLPGDVSPDRLPEQISDDGKIAYATVQYDQEAGDISKSAVDDLLELSADANTENLRVEVGGPVVSTAETATPGRSEIVGVVAAIIILLAAFGAVAVMGLSIVTGVAGVGAGVLGLLIFASLTDVPTVAPAFALMIGLGVGIDYALFVTARYRENLRQGPSVVEATAGAVDTAGRAVLVAGTTVIIALLGMFAVGVPFVSALGFAAVITVAFTMLVATSLLPSLFGFVGSFIERFRVPTVGGGSGGSGGSGGGSGGGWGRFIQRRPLLVALAAVAALVVMAIPMLDIRLALADDGSKPAKDNSRQAYDLLARGFGPGINGPLVVAIEEGEAGQKIEQDELANLFEEVAGMGGIDSLTPPQLNEEGDAALLVAYPDASPQSAATENTAKRLRNNVIPEALGDSSASASVGGATAANIDLGQRISDRLWIFFVIVIAFSSLLLMMVFRSVVIPLKSALANLLSVGAALGVLTAVFQWGWGMELLGIVKTGPVDAFIPLVLFAVLFGLSTDYEIFLVSRMRESFVRSGDAKKAVVDGLGESSRVVIAAALIMVCVFLAFVASDARTLKEIGLGLGTAVLVDAFVVRLVLVPAVMTMLGRLSWRFPSWLDRAVPNLNVEGRNGAQPEKGTDPGTAQRTTTT